MKTISVYEANVVTVIMLKRITEMVNLTGPCNYAKDG